MLRLVAWLLGFIALAAPIAALVLFIIAVAGSPGSCEDQARPVPISDELAASFQTKWDQFNDALAGGQISTIMVTDGEATSRARQWVEEHDLPVADLLVCFNVDGGSASGKLDIPFFWGDVDVLVRGKMTLLGEHPAAVIEEIELGGLPGMLTSPVEDLVSEMIDDETAKIALGHDYGVSFGAGEATISGQP